MEDAQLAIRLGADAVGFIFYPRSKRYIAPEQVRVITDALPPMVQRVGVFVDEAESSINTTCQTAGLSLAQLHFDSRGLDYGRLDYPYLPVVRAKTAEDLQIYNDSYRLVDAYVESYGGEGKRIPLEWFEAVDRSRIILAGGVSADNIEAIAPLGFYGVDLSSSVESSPGIKDSAKLEQFFFTLGQCNP